MTGLDESILEFFYTLGDALGEPVVMSPKDVRQNLEHRDLVDKSRSTYSRRMKTLADAGLLVRLDVKGAYYHISDLGVAYIEEELGAEELEDLV